MSTFQPPDVPQIVGIILAAGKGTRMKSVLPKVLHQVAGLPMIEWVRKSLAGAGIAQHCVVLSEDLAGFEEFLEGEEQMTVGLQSNRLGTGDAVAAVACCFNGVQEPPFAAGRRLKGAVLDSQYVLVCAGDVPCVTKESYANFVSDCIACGAKLGVLGMEVPDPQGYGRLVCDAQGALLKIVEEKDADPATRLINVCNTGIIFAETKTLFALLSRIDNQNAAGEYYLPDCFSLARADGIAIHVHVGNDYREFGGVNNRLQLSESEQILMARLRENLMLSGVTMRGHQTIFVEQGAEVAQDCEIESHVSILGATRLGKGCKIGAGSYLKNVRIGEGVVIGPGCILVDCVVEYSLAPATVKVL